MHCSSSRISILQAGRWGKASARLAFRSLVVGGEFGRVLAGIEAGEGFVVHELSMAKVGDWRKTATYLEDRRDHRELYRQLHDR